MNRVKLILAYVIITVAMFSVAKTVNAQFPVDITTQLSKFLVDLRAGALGAAQPISTVTVTSYVKLGAVAFASLPSAVDGRLIYCTDCTIASPCAGGGTGALAKGMATIWVCN